MSTPILVIPAPREITTEPRRSDKVFRGVVTGGGLSSLLILGLIAVFLGYRVLKFYVKKVLALLPILIGQSPQMMLETLQRANLA